MEIQIEFFSQQIKNFREEKQLTQEELAQELGISRQSIISLERGKCLPSLPLALSMAQLFDLALESFFYPENSKEEIKLNDSRKEVISTPRDLMPFSPWHDLNSLHTNIDRLFEESLPVSTKSGIMPTINVYEKEGVVMVEADLPGIKEEDLSIEVGEDRLTLSGNRDEKMEVKEENYFRRETSFGSFSRTIALPTEVDKDKAEAELKNGILTISLPRSAEAKPKLTKIKVNSK